MQLQVLLVEDDAMARLSLSQVLVRSGYGVEAVADGEQALALLDGQVQHSRFDIVLTDLVLQGTDGLQVLKAARAMSDPPEVILLTGYGTLQTAIESLRLGAFDYLLKPCKPDELLACLEKASERCRARQKRSSALQIIAQELTNLQGKLETMSGEPQPAELAAEAERSQVGELVINRRNYAVSFAGNLLSLTPTEYTLLCCLADARGQVMTYSAIARCVYRQDVDEITAQQLLKTHIHNLRHKLNPAYIVNVRGTGYKLVDPGGG